MKHLAMLAAAMMLLLNSCFVEDEGLMEVVDPEPSISTTTQSAVAEARPFTLSLGTVMGKVGATVSVPLSVSEGSYLTNADLLIEYDPVALKPVIAPEGHLGCATKADWQAGLWCGEQEAGVLRLMLADQADGKADAMTVCTLQFEVLSATDAPLTLTATAVGVCLPEGEQTDALVASLVTTTNGQVAVIAAE